MRTLSHDTLLRARDYIFTHSDDINRAWYRYNFEGGNTAAFMDALVQYQHPNGGFGGLVYEFEYQGPCLKCTEHAFRYIFHLREKPPANHPVIQKMMAYVLERYRSETGCWGELLTPEVHAGVHVPWWTYSEEENAPIADENERILMYRPNGQAALAAFVALYRDLVPQDLYRDIIRYPVEKILRYYDTASPLGGQSGKSEWHQNDIAIPYNMKCYNQFISCLQDAELAYTLKAILLQNPTACMNLNADNWQNDFENTACDIVSSPASFLYPSLTCEVDKSLDYLIHRLSENTCWHLNWRFGEGAALDRLQEQFEAHLTMLYLALLNRFGRVETPTS